MIWWLWLVAGAALAVAEVFTGTLVLIMLAVGALAAAGVGALGGGLVAESIAFAVVSALGLVAARPAIKRHLDRTAIEAQPMGVAALEGSQCLVLERVDASQGVVKVDGETWRARSYDGTQVFEPGEQVRIIEIKGATALVWRD